MRKLERIVLVPFGPRLHQVTIRKLSHFSTLPLSDADLLDTKWPWATRPMRTLVCAA